MKLVLFSLVLSLSLLAGCGGEPRVDASTDARMQASIERVKAALPEAQREEFEDALAALALEEVDVDDLADVDATGDVERGLGSRIDGKTGLEIIEAAGGLQAEQDRRDQERELERQESIDAIEALRARLTGRHADVLAGFVVEHARFRRSEDRFLGGDVIELAVRNDTAHVVARAYFRAVLVSPGREMPWVDDEFNYQIAGGLEPGESAVWNLQPNRFGAWRDAPDGRDDLVLVTRVVQLDGPDAEPLTGKRFTDRDAERLRDLVEEIGYAEAAEVESEFTARDHAVSASRDAAIADAVRAEADDLRRRRQADEEVRAARARFVIEEAHFYFTQRDVTPKPIIDLTVRNDTGLTVSRFYCRGVLATAGRETTWVDAGFNYPVRGGLQPGETRQFKLAPDVFGEWGRATKDRTDAVFTVFVLRLDGPDGAPLFSSDFTDTASDRLDKLEGILEEHGW